MKEKPPAYRFALALAFILVAAGPAGAQVQKFDFQNVTGPVQQGFTRVTPADSYSASIGYGFVTAPRSGVDGSAHTWTLFSKKLAVEDVVPASVLSNATRDCVIHTGRGNMEFRTKVPPGKYDVTLWLGDVTTPRYQVRAVVNEAVVDVDRMDVNHLRGNFDQSIFGGSVPRTVRVNAPDGLIDVAVGQHPGGADPITWTYVQDEDPQQPPYQRTATLVPPFTAAGLQALTLRPAADPPLRFIDGKLVIAAAPGLQELQLALDYFNAGAPGQAREALRNISRSELRAAKANGLFWVAGSPALIDEEIPLLSEAEALLVQLLSEKPDDHASEDLLLQVRLAKDAERYRRIYGYAHSGSSAAENLGRSCSLVEQFSPDHPYFLKGQILWLRNRGGLDPRRVTVSWERAQWLARQLDAAWGAVNPYVRLYATDNWTSDGKPWAVVDWEKLTKGGPDWARSLVSNLNVWLDLFEWWGIHRQAPEGDIGGGWTDDVEIVPAFGLMALVLEGASDIARESVIRFADGLWNSDVMDRDRGYQKQYADVEHTAEPTGNILHLYPLVRFGDPEGIERIMKSAKTFSQFFLAGPAESPLGHRHFKGNHMSSTQIATNPNHRADIALNGRVTAPFPFLDWYSSNPGIEKPLREWAASWVADAARTANGKPAGVFPNMVWVPTDGIGSPSGDWWSQQNTYGQFSAFPGYQYYLYNLAGWYFLRTGDNAFRAPFDAVRKYTQDWHDAGRPSPGSAPTPGKENVWAGGKLQTTALGSITNLKIGSGLPDWDEYLRRFGSGYSSFLLNPTDGSTINDLAAPAKSLVAGWPYRTTEGVMTDRILVPGWANVISYYIGADVFSVFFGMPVMAVTWENTTRLFAAAVTSATRTELKASTYLFSDTPRKVTMKLWQLERGRDYLLEAGPAAGLGLDAGSIDQLVPFRLNQLGEGVSFSLPGRTVYAVRIRPAGAAPPAPPAPSLPVDLAVASRDIRYDAASGKITVRVHNIGSAQARNIRVSLYKGAGSGGALIGTQIISLMEAPLDLVPRFTDLHFAYGLPGATDQVTAVVEYGDAPEITNANNTATSFLGGSSPELPPPMIANLDPVRVRPGETVRLTGSNFQAGLSVLDFESPSNRLQLEYVGAGELRITVAPGSPPGDILLSLKNPDGKRSNLLPLEVAEALDRAHTLYFAQFADGSGLWSEVALFNPDPLKTATAEIVLRDGEGRPMTVVLEGKEIRGQTVVTVPPLGLRLFRTGGEGPRAAGWAAVHSDIPLEGHVIFGGSEGLAGVRRGEVLADGFWAPVQTHQSKGVNTGIAAANLEDRQLILSFELADENGFVAATSSAALGPYGHLARFLEQFQWQPAGFGSLDLSRFRGLLRVKFPGKVSATVLQMMPGEYATLPVTAQAVPGGAVRPLHFAQFADGRSGSTQIASSVLLVNRDPAAQAAATIRLRGGRGQPLAVVLNGEAVSGQKDLVIPPGGMRILETDGQGPLTIGSVSVASDRPLAGVIVFSGGDGFAGVGSSEEFLVGVLAPVDIELSKQKDSGVAVTNLEEAEVRLTVELLDENGRLLAVALDTLGGLGHFARFVGQFQWTPVGGQALNLADFRGMLRIRATGKIAATVLQTRPGQMATLPVIPR